MTNYFRLYNYFLQMILVNLFFNRYRSRFLTNDFQKLAIAANFTPVFTLNRFKRHVNSLDFNVPIANCNSDTREAIRDKTEQRICLQQNMFRNATNLKY